ncbi:hypothetical protein [Streptomyces sp. NPDC002205]|uniref:hypothetical protein n=1 Tax=Streptomyces sp. NPDC002205 TaxID=3154411 RepID=UPI00331D42F3
MDGKSAATSTYVDGGEEAVRTIEIRDIRTTGCLRAVLNCHRSSAAGRVRGPLRVRW